MDISITFAGNTHRGSPLCIKYDKNVEIYHVIARQAISTGTLNANELTKAQGKGYEILRTTGEGRYTSGVTFNYEIHGDHIRKQITNSFPIIVTKKIRQV